MNLPIKNDVLNCRSTTGAVSDCERCSSTSGPQTLARGGCRSMHHGDILAVRSRFLSTGAVPDGVPTPLVRSWQRSSRFGFASPTLARQRDRLEDAGLRSLKERNADLIASSLEEMASLAHELSALGGVVILTDPTGIVLNRLGEGGFSDDADRLGLNEGVDWSENAIGTNAIGTVALEMVGLSIIGAEHLFCLNTSLSCSAVPILDPSGLLAGVLDVSTSFTVPHDHLLPLLRRAVIEIERRLFDLRFHGHAQLRFHSSQYLFGGPRDGVLAFDEDRLIGANRAALELLGHDWSAVGRARFQNLFAAGYDVAEQTAVAGECRLRSTDGEEFFARLQLPRRPSCRAAPPRSGPKGMSGDEVDGQEMWPHLALEKIQDRAALRFRRMKVGHLIYGADLTDECGEATLIVASGRYRCFASHEGRELTLFTLGCGDALPLRADMAVEVTTEGEAAVVPRALFQRLVRDYPEFGRCVLSVIETFLGRSLSMVGDMAFRSVRYRVIRHVCTLAERDGRETSAGTVIDPAPTGDELAAAIGAARQSVSTILAELTRSSDILRPTPRSLVVRDIERLRTELARAA
ncbi:helix-turn-helix domain-containing protein [Pleomorphomonas sp. JP5]|uniref:helix-turn-helix domain-containing protein n=1 Tax=Pleomorphomonas sp. JP5 TaxID=2942998 RepID=UPI002044BF02|nr:helix-turn-helix domain-containing protein [Pleomorphomonas sp. JP5]MCM5560085.1 helix-turn-helix domain-containing protein [Pleomorphomonas sp. JP5]